MALFKKKEQRAEAAADQTVTADDNLLRALIGGTSSINKASAMEIPAVQACVNLISDIVSTLPIKLYEKNDGEITEITDDPRVKLLNGDTGDTLNDADLKKCWIIDYYMSKGAYTYIDRDIYGVAKGLYYVDEAHVSIIPGTNQIFKDYTISVDGKKYPKSDFLKILRKSKGKGVGTSIISESNIIMLVAFNTMKYENSSVKKGGNKKGFLTSQNQQTKDAMAAIKEAWAKMFSNSQDTEDNICVLNAGMDFKEASATSLEMQLNENKKTNSEDICRLFCIPPEIFANVSETAKQALISNCIMPTLNTIEAALDSDLLLESEKGMRYFAFDTRELTRGNLNQRYSAYEIGLRNGFLQLSDVRAQEDLPPIDFPYIKLGLNDVFYNPETKVIYTPNTNQSAEMGSLQAGNVMPAGDNSENNLQKASDSDTGLEKNVPINGDTADSRAEELRYNNNHDPKTGRFSSGSWVDKSGKSGIIKLGSDEVNISTIEQPIEQQHTGKGNPNAILTFDVPLNERQQKLLDSLPEYDSRVTVPKKSVNMTDLSALTAKTGDEFALFTKGGERLVIRGNEIKVNISPKLAKKMCKDGYKWSGHTHPGCTDYVLTASDGDKTILKCFEQEQSVIYNSKGNFRTFELNE